MANNSKNDKVTMMTVCEAGITANFAATDSWVLLGKTYKRGDILAGLAACIQASQKTKVDHDAWRASASAEREQYDEFRPVLAAFKKVVESEFGETSTKMVEFGWEPAKPAVKSAEVKAAAATKARKTKAAKKAALDAVTTGSAGQPAASPEPSVPAAATAATAAPKGS